MTEQNLPEMDEEASSPIFEETTGVDDIKIAILEPAADRQESAQDGVDSGIIRVNATAAPHGEQTGILKTAYTKSWGSLLKGLTDIGTGSALVVANWEFEGIMLRDIIQTARLGYTIPYPTNIITGREVVPFYVPNRLSRAVHVAATMVTRGATIDVFFDHTIKISFPGLEVVRADLSVTKILTRESKRMFIQLGNTKTSRVPDYGFSASFTATVNTDDNKGELGVMQFLRGGITYYKANGEEVRVNTNDKWFLDKKVDSPDLTYGAYGVKPIERGRSTVIAIDDSPFIELFDGLKKVVFDETFRTYLVYRNHKPGSKWVPLGVIQWKWSGMHERIGSSSAPWLTTFATTPVVTKTPFIPTDELPRWDGETGQLAQQIDFKVARSEGELQPEEWKRPTQPAKQMIITTVSAHTPQLVAAIENAIGSPVSKSKYGPNVLPVWASPEMANEAKKVAGVAKVEELSAEARYNVKPVNIQHEKHFVIYVAPYFWYNDSAINIHFSTTVAPKTLEDVGKDLVNICNSRGYNGATFTIKSFSLLYFDFPNLVTDENVLRAMAAHPQVNYVQRLSAFVTIDDPTNPTS